MFVKGIIKKGEYFDSVTLMLVTKKLNEFEGVEEASIVMGTEENKDLLKTTNMLLPEFKDCIDSDLIIVVKIKDESQTDKVIETAEQYLIESKKKKSGSGKDYNPKSIDGALSLMSDANMVLISIAGKYAADEAMKALQNKLNVMIFSDNVSVEKEIELKKYAKENGLLVMGPDCGTAIINGAPLCFANVVNKGNIGIVAASGTGLQEVSTIISNEGGGISQAIGTGGRDVKEEVGGLMFIESIKALAKDNNTKVITLVSKPPADSVVQKIAEEIKKVNKPFVAIFIGGNNQILKDIGVYTADTLEETALISVALSQDKTTDEISEIMSKKENELKSLAKKLSQDIKPNQKYLRGLFAGGTLCDEAQLIFNDVFEPVYSPVPLDPKYKLNNIWESFKNTVIDLGEDEFTVGRPHPMIDYSLRNKRIIQEASDKDTAVILLDVVIGYGSNLNPAEELCPVIKEAFETANKIGNNIKVICSITGTDKDVQKKKELKIKLEEAGAIVMPTNASACKLTAYVVSDL